MATSDRLEFRREEQRVIKDGDTSNTSVGPLVPVDLQMFPTEIEKRADAGPRDSLTVGPDNTLEVAHLAFPSEENDGRSQAVDLSVAPAPSVRNAARSSIFVIESSGKRLEERLRGTSTQAPIFVIVPWDKRIELEDELEDTPRTTVEPDSPTATPRRRRAQYSRAAFAFIGAWWRNVIGRAYGLAQRASLERRLRERGRLTIARLSSLRQQSALATRRWAFVATRAVSIGIASGKNRGRASFVALCRRAHNLSERGKSHCVTAWTTSHRAARTAGRDAVAAIRAFSSATATWGRDWCHASYRAVCRVASSLAKRSESTWETPWRIGGRSLVNACRDGKASLIAVTRVIWREVRVAGRAFPTSVGHVTARYSFGHAWIPAVRIRPAIGQDIRRALALFVCGVAVGVAGIVLLIPRVPSVMTSATGTGGASPAHRLGDTPLSAAKVPDAPIAEPAAAPGRDRLAGTVGRGSNEPNRADGNVPLQRPSAAPRPAPVSPFRGSLAVSSSPEGAQVFVNGVSVGVTPLLLRDMPVGSRAVRVELDGHERWSSAVRIVASERTLVAARLLPASTQ